MKEEAESGGPARPTLMTLEEIGWLAAENEEAITIAMELEPGPEIDGTATTQAGRWRLHVARVCIQEVREMEFGKAFPKRSIR